MKVNPLHIDAIMADSTDQIDLCAAAPVVGTADRRLILLDVSAF